MAQFTFRSAFTAGFIALAGVAAIPFIAPSSVASSSAVVSRIDVAMNPATFYFEGDTNENGAPAAGTPFVVQGYIYPGGTFDRQGESSGVLSDGSPEFPELVMGIWTCSGWHLLDGDAPAGAVVTTRQSFDFDLRMPGSEMLVTEGIEMAEFDLPFSRAVTGGTGGYRGARGEHRQVYVAFNEAGGFNSSFDMTILRPRD